MALVPLAAAVMLTVALVVPRVVVTVKAPVVEPTGIGIDAGTVADAGVSEVRVTVVATGAAAERVTVPAEVLPPTTDVGLSVTLDTLGTALMLSEALGVPPFSEAPMVDVPAVSVCVVVMLNVAVVEPARTVTELGTVARAVLLEDRATA